MDEKERAIEICNNLTHTINTAKFTGIRSEFRWANSKADKRDLRKKRRNLMNKFKLTPKDIINYGRSNPHEH